MLSPFNLPENFRNQSIFEDKNDSLAWFSSTMRQKMTKSWYLLCTHRTKVFESANSQMLRGTYQREHDVFKTTKLKLFVSSKISHYFCSSPPRKLYQVTLHVCGCCALHFWIFYREYKKQLSLYDPLYHHYLPLCILIPPLFPSVPSTTFPILHRKIGGGILSAVYW